jgi:hypothetical protein
MAKKGNAVDAPGVSMSPAVHNDFQAEDDHRTLTRALEIHGDQSRMRNVRRHHRRVTRALTSLGSTLRAKR